jgi:hypothetical protein
MPQLPEDLPSVFTGYKLTGGVMMASDFLMSLHINRGRDDLKSFRQKNVYIVGCGLTAIDAACEIRALLLQNGVEEPDVKIVYYREFEQSAAYRTNFLEFKKALGEGVGVLENSKIVKIHKNSNGISAIEMQNGDILPCDLLLIAIGTKPNIEHIQSFAGRSDVSFFGDCNPLYTGSVVKALASVKNGIESAILKTQNNESTFDDKNLLWLKKDVKNVRKVQEDLYEIEIESPILFEKADAGNVLKLQIMGRNSIALTITHKNDGNIYGYLFNTNKETQVLIDGFFKGEIIHINGINCKNFPNVDGKSVIIASQKLAYIFGKVHKDNRIILLDDFVQYEHNTHYVLAIENDKKLLAVRQMLPENSYDVINFQKMNCMLGGICGRCVTDSGSYGCL